MRTVNIAAGSPWSSALVGLRVAARPFGNDSSFLPRTLARALFLLVAALGCSTRPADPTPVLDVVLAGGRVMDPESGVDAVLDVGIRADRIVAIAAGGLAQYLAPGGRLIDVSGLVVSPGFIDLHAHGQSREANRFQARDGVTTALELEWGYPAVAEFLNARRGKATLNFGASVSHGMVRSMVMDPSLATGAVAAAEASDPLRAFQSAFSEGFYRRLSDEALPELMVELERGLAEGGLGIGMAHQYYPGADRREILRVFEFAATQGAPIYTHVRSMGLDAIQEVVANAASTGASLHIVHVNSSSLQELPEVLDLIGGAQRHGVDVTTEAYPYTAGSTGITSAIFDEGWQERLDIDYGDVQWQDTGERLTEETFKRYRAEGGTVIIHMMKDELIDLAMATPFVMVASDGMPYAPGAHPRSAGTFSRVLGLYVRERGAVDLMAALGKMTLQPARRLERIAPEMIDRGRLRAGAFADIVVFDAETIHDTATFDSDLSYSEGVRYLLVNGTLVIEAGEILEGVFPGRAIEGKVGALADRAP